MTKLPNDSKLDVDDVASTQNHTPGVIRCTRDYLQSLPESPIPVSPQDSEDANISSPISTFSEDDDSTISTSRDNPREIRNRAEKMRRDKMNQSVAQLASIVPPVVASGRKLDKTTVLRLSAHYLRSNQHVFGKSIGQSPREFSPSSIMTLVELFNGFLITVTYRGIIVVVSQNVQKFLGYSEVDLLGINLLNMIHEDDRAMLKEQLMPKSQNFGPNGELLIPNEPGAASKVEEALAKEKRKFVLRFKKLGQRSEPSQYLTCHVEGSMRKSDQASGVLNRCGQMVRRVRARTENPWSSGNDVVFVAMVRPQTETFMNDIALESHCMEYRTRHFIDGQIIECDARISMVTGYMKHEVNGVNAMNFMHRDDVRWVVVALREMYDQHRLYGESCYRLMTKTGQFIYMKTRGHLVVDKTSRACTSFVCTNTVVDEKEGKYLIKEMRKKFTLMINKNGSVMIPVDEEITDDSNGNQETVEHPSLLGVVVLHLVTDLPSPPPKISEDRTRILSSQNGVSLENYIDIIPPNREKIVRGIEKIYDVIKTLDRDQYTNTLQQGSHEESANRNTSSFDADNPIASTSKGHRVAESSRKLTNPNEIFNTNNQSGKTMYMTAVEDVANKKPTKSSISSPDLGFFDEWSGDTSPFVIENTYETVESTYNEEQILQAIYHDTDQISNMSPFNSIAGKANSTQLMPAPTQSSTSQLSTRNKRVSNFDSEITKHKKKITESPRQTVLPSASGSHSPRLDNFLEEPFFNIQVESAMSSLGEIDANLLELDTTDIQTILQQLESQSENVF